MSKLYVTTPIYYVNDVPHIGHAYSTIAADILYRFYGGIYGKNNVRFLTGTDEHGQKVSRAAESRGLEPKEHIDEMVQPFKELWEKLEVKPSRFIRTTDSDHEKTVQHIFSQLKEKDFIYEGTYEGWYCVYEETFYPESQLKDSKCCPDCGRETEWVEEESYFFKLSEFGQKIKDKITSNQLQILPESRKNEVLGFINSGLQDISVSRTGFKWGVPVPFNKKHVVYVWFDALINYLTGCGYPENKTLFENFWQAQDSTIIHILGKDIVKFHAVIWPAMLLALDIKLPNMVFAHGFLTLGEKKISKSKGITVDPFALIDKYGADAYRYFFMSEFTFGLDGEFTEETMIKRINSDLANDLGNLVHRTANMMNKYFDGIVPTPSKELNKKKELGGFEASSMAIWAQEKTIEDLSKLDFRHAISRPWSLIKFLNKYIENSTPWTLKKENKEEDLSNVMYTLAEGIRIISQLIYPFMPEAAQKIWEQLSMEGTVADFPFEKVSEWGVLPVGSHFKVTKPLFPRIEQ